MIIVANLSYDELEKAKLSSWDPWEYIDLRKHGLTLDQAHDAVRRNIHRFGSLHSYMIDGGHSYKDLTDALDAGLSKNNISTFGVTKSNGIPQKDLIDSIKNGIPLQQYNVARVAYNIPHDDLIEFNNLLKDQYNYNNTFDKERIVDKFKEYNHARNEGIKHSEIMDVQSQNFPLHNYKDYRTETQATHQETIDALKEYGYSANIMGSIKKMVGAQKADEVWDNRPYKDRNKNIITDEDGFDPYIDKDGRNNSYLYDYRNYMVQPGHSNPSHAHEEFIDGVKNNIDSSTYYNMSRSGMPHKDILSAYKLGGSRLLNDLHMYSGSGTTPTQLLEAHQRGISLHDYSSTRNAIEDSIIEDTGSRETSEEYYNFLHEKTMTQLDPSYSPYDEWFK